MQDKEIMERLREYDQLQAVRFFEELDAEGKAQLMAELAVLDLQALANVSSSELPPLDPAVIAPYRDVIRRDDPDTAAALQAGEAALRAGRAGTLLVAGGQGSRLGFDGPKGNYPLGAVSKRTLFEMHAQRLLGLGKRYGVVPPLYLMTSAVNHEQTVASFEASDYFGLPRDRVIIFQQGRSPALDDKGRLLLASKGGLLLVPNGNGGLFAALDDSGAFAHMRENGVDVISYIHVDNPLALSCDPLFIGHHLRKDSQYSCKAVSKVGPDEKVGNFASVNGRLGVIEYTEVPGDMADRRDEQNELLYGWGSPGIFLFSRDFAEIQAKRTDLPVHKAHKKLPHIGVDGELVNPSAPNGIKLETYAHDTLLDAERTIVFECLRECEFAPVKNADGVDSASSARALMTALFRRWLEEAGATVVGDPDIEISPLVALDASDLADIAPKLNVHQNLFLK